MPDRSRNRYSKHARKVTGEILTMRKLKALKISHHIQLRFELCSETLVEEIDKFKPGDKVGTVSLMDHTLSQRQLRDIKLFEDYVCEKIAVLTIILVITSKSYVTLRVNIRKSTKIQPCLHPNKLKSL